MASPALTIVSGMLTPALLILANGSLVGACSSRYGRLYDRARGIIRALEDEAPARDRPGTLRWLERYEKRILLMERALVAFSAASAILVGDSVAIAADQYMGDAFGWLPVVLAVGGALTMLCGVLFMLKEALEGGRQIHDEIKSAREHFSVTPE